jgi:LuxR family maltose regulon positive regulatory protein
MAVQEIGHALSLAEEGEFITIFTLEGCPIPELLRKALKSPNNTRPFSPFYVRKVLAAFPASSKRNAFPDELSERELDVLRQIAKGFSNQEIADTLYISLNTVKSHTKQIFLKLDVKNRTEAVKRGKEQGLVET